MRTLLHFATWAEVLAHVAAGKAVWYQAPMDRTASLVRCSVAGPKALTVRVKPWNTSRGKLGAFQAFKADAGHLDRFRRQAPEGYAEIVALANEAARAT